MWYYDDTIGWWFLLEYRWCNLVIPTFCVNVKYIMKTFGNDINVIYFQCINFLIVNYSFLYLTHQLNYLIHNIKQILLIRIMYCGVLCDVDLMS
jgi:hypothetical protein